MPVVYAPAAPVAAAYASTLALGSAQREEAARARAATGIGGGRGYAVDPSVIARIQSEDADRMQAAIANRDRMDFEGRRFAAELDNRAGMINLQGNNEAALQDRRIAGQIAMQNNELSQQEKIRYMRMKNALGSIEADPNLTAEEKGAYRQMLQSGINPYEQRLAKQRIDAQAEANKMLADQRRTQAALNETDLKLSAQGFNERTAYHVDSSIISQIIGDLKQNLPGAERLDPKVLAAMANEIAMNQGLGQTFYQESANKWIPVSGGKGAAGAKGEVQGGMNEDRFMKIYDAAVAQATKEQDQKNDDDTYAHPRGVDWFNTRVDQIVQQRMNALQGFTQTQAPKGYKSPFAKPATVASTEDQQQIVKQKLEKADLEASRLKDRNDVDPTLKWNALSAIQSAKQIIAKYPDPAKMPESTRKKLLDLEKVISSVPRHESVTNPPQPGSKPALGGAAPAQSQGQAMESPF